MARILFQEQENKYRYAHFKIFKDVHFLTDELTI